MLIIYPVYNLLPSFIYTRHFLSFAVHLFLCKLYCLLQFSNKTWIFQLISFSKESVPLHCLSFDYSSWDRANEIIPIFMYRTRLFDQSLCKCNTWPILIYILSTRMEIQRNAFKTRSSECVSYRCLVGIFGLPFIFPFFSFNLFLH